MLGARVQEWIGNRRNFILTMAVLTLAFVTVTFISSYPDDIKNYYNQVLQLFSGLMPYSEFQFEYPPFAIPFFVLPGLVSWDITSYRAAYVVMAYVALAVIVYFSYKIADKYMMEKWKVNVLMIALVVVGSVFVFSRYDIFPAMLIAISLWLYLEKRYSLAFVVMALACMTKLYPAIFLIAMLVPFFMRREWKPFFKGIVVFAAVCLILELPFILYDPSTAFAYLSYHSDRGLQIESVLASFMMFAALLVQTDITVVQNYGSSNLVGTLPDAIAPFMNIMMAAVLVVFVLVIMVRIHRSGRAKENAFSIVGLLCLAMIMIFTLFSKVYSAQYIIWIIPLLLFVLVPSVGPRHAEEIKKMLIPFFVFTVASYCCYLYLMEFNGIAVLFTLLKNVFHVVLTLEIIHLCLYETRSDDRTDSVERGMFECFRRKSAD